MTNYTLEQLQRCFADGYATAFADIRPGQSTYGTHRTATNLGYLPGPEMAAFVAGYGAVIDMRYPDGLKTDADGVIQ